MTSLPERKGRGSAPARAALAGNPSDGYNGAVLALAISELRAEAVVSEAACMSVHPRSELVSATVRRVERESLPGGVRCSVRWRTSIPRGVGLGGSSAIVIATIRALYDLHGAVIAPDALAELALAVETEELGIAAGPQDRVAEAYGGLTFMDFAEDRASRYESLDPRLLPPLLIGWRAEAGSDSGPVHSGLRHRHARGEPEVRAALQHAARAAHEARDALLAGDHARFCAAVDATFDARRQMLTLDRRHTEMIELARGAGAAGNYTGSGGAIVAVCRDRRHRKAVAGRLTSAGCGVVSPNPVP